MSEPPRDAHAHAGPEAGDAGQMHAFRLDRDSDLRLDLLVAERLGTSRTRAATLIATGGVTVDGRRERASYRATAGEVVAVTVRAEAPLRPLAAESIPIAVAYEDEELLVVDKPAGMVVHPAPGNWTGTLVNALLGRGVPLSGQVARGPAARLQAAQGQAEAATPGSSDGGEARGGGGGGGGGVGVGGAAVRPGIVHRLDKDTSGLILVAKTERAHRALGAAMAARRISRRYAALCWGHVGDERISIDRPLGRDPRDRKRMAIVSTGRSARTDVLRLARFDSVDLLRARLHSGRTHQIRVHLAAIGHPVVGDDNYGGGGGRRLLALAPRRQFLHAAWLRFSHPASGDIVDVRSPLPADLVQSLVAAAGVDSGISIPHTDTLDYFGFFERED